MEGDTEKGRCAWSCLSLMGPQAQGLTAYSLRVKPRLFLCEQSMAFMFFKYWEKINFSICAAEASTGEKIKRIHFLMRKM